jgi:hypothetical protein
MLLEFCREIHFGQRQSHANMAQKRKVQDAFGKTGGMQILLYDEEIT